MTDLGDARVRAWVTFQMDDPSGNSPPAIDWFQHVYTDELVASGQGWGWGRFVDVASAKSRYVGHDGSVIVHCHVEAIVEESWCAAATSNNACTGGGAGVATTIAVPPSNIAWHLEWLMVSEQGTTEVKFLVQGSEFRAHGLVIAARSPALYEAVVASATTDDADHVRIDDATAAVFEAVLHFIYTDELPPTDDDGDLLSYDDRVAAAAAAMAMARNMLATADRFGLERMKAMCETIMCRYVGPENVMATLKLADRHHCPGFKEFCIEHIMQSYVLHGAVETQGFKDLKATSPWLLEELIVKFSTFEF